MQRELDAKSGLKLGVCFSRSIAGCKLGAQNTYLGKFSENRLENEKHFLVKTSFFHD